MRMAGGIRSGNAVQVNVPGTLCQEVCPFSRKFSTPTSEPAFMARPGVHGAPLTELLSLSQEEFSALFKGSPVKRAKRRGLLRNVAVALGNWGSPDGIPSLLSALEDSAC
jgi:epoxyqueuosine reductase